MTRDRGFESRNQCGSLSGRGRNSAANPSHRRGAQKWCPNRFANGQEAAIPLFACAVTGRTILPSLKARSICKLARHGSGAPITTAMIKRFLIASIIGVLFLGGVAYFHLVFKPKMIKEFLSQWWRR